jgi:aryl-alcohol dehydrogenase-like predicted oxidoreductase
LKDLGVGFVPSSPLGRGFLTGQIKSIGHQLLAKFEQIISEYFDADTPSQEGLLTVHYVASQMNISANYLSDL